MVPPQTIAGYPGKPNIFNQWINPWLLEMSGSPGYPTMVGGGNHFNQPWVYAEVCTWEAPFKMFTFERRSRCPLQDSIYKRWISNTINNSSINHLGIQYTKMKKHHRHNLPWQVTTSSELHENSSNLTEFFPQLQCLTTLIFPSFLYHNPGHIYSLNPHHQSTPKTTPDSLPKERKMQWRRCWTPSQVLFRFTHPTDALIEGRQQRCTPPCPAP